MSTYEDERFNAVVAMIDDKPSVLPMEGTPVMIDAGLGEEFRHAAISEQMIVARSLGIVPGRPLPDRAFARLQSRLDLLPNSPSSTIHQDELVAVTGKGLIIAKEYASDGYDIEVISPDVCLFGHLEGIRYDDYPYVPGIETLTEDSDEEVEVMNREGLVMVLGAAMICAAEDSGELQGKYEYGLVPLSEPGLIVHKAIRC